MSHARHRFETATNPHVFYSLLTRCRIPCACHAKRHPNVKSAPYLPVFLHFCLRNVLRATTAWTFSTCQLQSGLRMVCFIHFDLEMCFAPKRRAILNLSPGQIAPHPPLYRAYCSTLRGHKSLEKTQCFATFLPFRAPGSSFF